MTAEVNSVPYRSDAAISEKPEIQIFQVNVLGVFKYR